MRSTNQARRAALKGLPAAGILLLAFVLVSAAPPEKHLTVFSTAANYSVAVVGRQGREYVGLLELLDPLGTVSAKVEGSRWRIHYNNILGDFSPGQSHGRVQGRDADLTGKFLLENGRGLVPLSALNSLLPRFLGGPATLHAEADRLFIGSVGTHFTAAVAPDDASRLVLHFTAPVNPTIATEPGKVRMTFSRDPLIAPASPVLTFDSKAIPSATFAESNGAAEIKVSTSVPLLASFSPDGRTITLAPTKTQAAATATASPVTAPLAAPATAPAPANSAPTVERRYFAVVDASHGGSDRGEALSNTLAEKDITVAFARRLRHELEGRGITTLVLRDSDANISLDDRAYFANTTHAAIYIALHAASNGHGVRLYTALLPYTAQEERGPFHSWSTAQQRAMPLSQAAAASVAGELTRQQVHVRVLTSPLRPLNNVATAAIAVEVAPPALDLGQLASPDYQQLVVSAVANGIVAIRAQLGAAP
jgi:N-acetylmuramoyl-L-alanine amidase